MQLNRDYKEALKNTGGIAAGSIIGKKFLSKQSAAVSLSLVALGVYLHTQKNSKVDPAIANALLAAGATGALNNPQVLEQFPALKGLAGTDDLGKVIQASDGKHYFVSDTSQTQLPAGATQQVVYDQQGRPFVTVSGTSVEGLLGDMDVDAYVNGVEGMNGDIVEEILSEIRGISGMEGIDDLVGLEGDEEEEREGFEDKEMGSLDELVGTEEEDELDGFEGLDGEEDEDLEGFDEDELEGLEGDEDDDEEQLTGRDIKALENMV
ncbi:hypothetical protein [Algivirga pacifica]|uniref:Uncharacterized protein n=1 Tax=Algivirga pacifica TaxID=1162670 RepID=A0ABP9DKY4_9BACT